MSKTVARPSKVSNADPASPPYRSLKATGRSGTGYRDDFAIDTRWLVQFALGSVNTRRSTLRPRRSVTTQGEPIRNIYLVQSGCVRTYYLYPDGRSITLAYWTSGMMIGLPGVSQAGQRYLWSSETVEETELLSVSLEQFQNWLASVPQLQRQVVALMELKVRHLSLITQMLAAPSIVSRLGLVLENLCSMHGMETAHGTLIGIRLTHADIGDMVGSSRQWITRSLQSLRNAGIIDYPGRRLIVLRRDLLSQLDTILN